MEFYRLTSRYSFYSFITSALVSEANKSGKEIFLEHRIEGRLFADIYLPKGLPVFNLGNDNPIAVEISRVFNERRCLERYSKVKSALPRAEFVLIVSSDRWAHYSSKDFHVFGVDFIKRLIDRNPDAYLNYVIGDNNTQLINEIVVHKKISEDRDRILIKNDKLFGEIEINADDPAKLSKINENNFKAYLNSDDPNGSSNCAIIMGNGASIPFGSDSWLELIDNISSYLEPLFISKKENIKKALSNSSYAISSFVKATLEREGLRDKYIEAVHYCIYRKFNNLMFKCPSIIKAVALLKKKKKIFATFDL